MRSGCNLLGQGYIDLSKRRVSPEEITKCEDKYNRAKIINGILRNVSEITGYVRGPPHPSLRRRHGSLPWALRLTPWAMRLQDLEELYTRTAWKLEEKSGPASSYELFKMATTYGKTRAAALVLPLPPPLRRCRLGSVRRVFEPAGRTAPLFPRLPTLPLLC